METLLADSIDKFLAGCSTPAVVRELERELTEASGGPRFPDSPSGARALQDGGLAGAHQATTLWAEIEASGYLDLLVAEAAGGAGLGLSDAFAVWLACGRHALPLPMAQTMLVRAALVHCGIAAPSGPLAIATHSHIESDGAIHCQGVPMGLVADWVLVADAGHAGGARLLPVAAGARRATGVHGSQQAHCHWPAAPSDAIVLPPGCSWLHAGALLSAALMAGALQRVLEATLTYASQRAQFGKSIGKFQAVQQQMSVMAEQVFAARMAAEIGCATSGIVPHPLRAALAKARTSEAAEKVVAIAHAVHGAIGVTAEYDLQLYTRRLQEWRGDFGSQAYWHAQLGAALLASPQTSSAMFLLAELVPTSLP